MKPILLAGTALLVLIALEPAAQAQRVTFTYKPPGSIVTYTVPATGLYQITGYGAQGGDAIFSDNIIGPGGLGAEIGGNFTLIAGEILQIAVGGEGGSNPTFGGGGGYFDYEGDTSPGGAGLTTTAGGDGDEGAGGTNGKGGAGVVGDVGGGGAGFYSDGGTAQYPAGYTYGTGGAAFPTLTGGTIGGGCGGGCGSWNFGLGASGGVAGTVAAVEVFGPLASMDTVVVAARSTLASIKCKSPALRPAMARSSSTRYLSAPPASRTAMATSSLTWPSNTAASMPQLRRSAIPACSFCRTRSRPIARGRPVSVS